jgi:hypothetical protein
VDTAAVIVWALAAAAFALAAWQTSHRPPPEDLTRQIFPE